MLQIKTTEQPNEQHREWPSVPGVLARLDLRVKHSDDFFGKLSFTASVYLNPEIKESIPSDIIDKIILEAGYPDSNSIMTYRNSGILLKSDITDMQPMIWTPGNSGSILKTIYNSNSNNIVVVKYKVLFDMQQSATIGLTDSYSSSVNIQIKSGSISSCLVTIAIL